ncbi:MAG: LmbE family N-acetylglucosaminyl deacetylase [Urechidicola sp.]|jgi:LmbE family N-acetylglucosaminyl deacetylase
MIKRVLIVAAHPDDEAIGCSGVMAKFKSEGVKIGLVFMTDGIASRSPSENEANDRCSGKETAMKILTPDYCKSFDYPDNKMDSVPLLNIVKSVESSILEFEPDLVITHWHGDLNIDHRITYQSVVTAIRPQPESSVKELWCFEVNSSTDYVCSSFGFTPNLFVDISRFWTKKLEYLSCYKNELRQYPHSRSVRSIEAKAVVRGSQCGIDYAESFICERRIIR